MLAIQSINNTQPAVQPLREGYQVLRSDLLSDSSGRTAETGKALRYTVRQNTYKITLKFKGPAADIHQVEELVSAYELAVTFFDGQFDNNGQPIYVTGHKFYPSDRTANYTGYMGELSVNLIEI